MGFSKTSQDALFLLLGANMVLAMHSGFAFLELGTVRSTNQVNALVKSLVDFSVTKPGYFLVWWFFGVGYSGDGVGGYLCVKLGSIGTPVRAQLRVAGGVVSILGAAGCTASDTLRNSDF